MAYLLPKYVVSPSLFVFELFSCYFQVFGAILGGNIYEWGTMGGAKKVGGRRTWRIDTKVMEFGVGGMCKSKAYTHLSQCKNFG